MGDQIDCKARFNGKVSTGKAYLETDKLLFRGGVRVSIPLKDITGISSDANNLKVTFTEGTLVLELGERAAKWETRIRSPKSLLDKLGIKPDSKVSVIGVGDAGFLSDLKSRTPNISNGRRVKSCDHIFSAPRKRKPC